MLRAADAAPTVRLPSQILPKKAPLCMSSKQWKHVLVASVQGHSARALTSTLYESRVSPEKPALRATAAALQTVPAMCTSGVWPEAPVSAAVPSVGGVTAAILHCALSSTWRCSACAITSSAPGSRLRAEFDAGSSGSSQLRLFAACIAPLSSAWRPSEAAHASAQQTGQDISRSAALVSWPCTTAAVTLPSTDREANHWCASTGYRCRCVC